MFVGLCGGICSGKQSIADFLVAQYGFQQLFLGSDDDDVGGPRAAPVRADPSSTSIRFGDVKSLVDFVTRRWSQRWVTTYAWDAETLELITRRPFFLLISVDAPLGVRWTRLKKRCEDQGREAPSLEAFVSRNDAHLYADIHGVARLIDQAQLRLVNLASPISSLHRSLLALDLTNPRRLRPDWDQYFMQLASLAAQRSNCMKRRVGCVLVRERRVISTGYNGTARNMRNCNEGGCRRCNQGAGSGLALSTCRCLHAEENALLEAGRERIRPGTVVYCDTCPCLTCSIKIAQVGISEVVYGQGYSMDQETAAVFAEGGVRFRQFVPPRTGLVDWSLSSSTEQTPSDLTPESSIHARVGV